MTYYLEGPGELHSDGNHSNKETFNTLLNLLRRPATEEERRILATAPPEDEDDAPEAEREVVEPLTPEARAELEAIEAEINEELLAFEVAPASDDGERQEQLDALVMTQARGVGALLGFAQNAMRPNWIRAKAMQEIVRRAEGNEHPLLAGAFRLGADAIPADAPRVVSVDGLVLEKDKNEVVHAECLTRKGTAGYALAVDLEEKGKAAPLGENALLHVALFDRQSGNSFRHATAKLERLRGGEGGPQYHVELFDRENLTRNDVERADALFWVEQPESGGE
jgi:hypothetical protein